MRLIEAGQSLARDEKGMKRKKRSTRVKRNKREWRETRKSIQKEQSWREKPGSNKKTKSNLQSTRRARTSRPTSCLNQCKSLRAFEATCKISKRMSHKALDLSVLYRPSYNLAFVNARHRLEYRHTASNFGYLKKNLELWIYLGKWNDLIWYQTISFKIGRKATFWVIMEGHDCN